MTKGYDEIVKKYIEIILERMAEFAPEYIYLFGSLAKGNFREESDIDIAFYSEKEVGSYEVFQKSQEIAEIIGRDIDIIDLSTASTVFAVQIISHGKVIFSENKSKLMNFEMYTLSYYAKLNEERAEILEQYK